MVEGFFNAMNEFWSQLGSVIETFGVVDLFDIIVVAFLLYNTILLVRETRAMQLVKGIAVVLVVYLIASRLNMITLNFIITTVLQWGIVALAIVFQPELRRALEQVGRSRITGIGRLGGESADQAGLAARIAMIDAVAESARVLSATRTGALMVLERQTMLGDVMTTGAVIDAEPGVPLITNIFYPNTPLHDGAMILRAGRIYAAGCFLPLSQNDEIGRELGTRHRAALGMSEVSDAVVVVVSEETGAISVALEGKLQRNLSSQNLIKLLTARLIGQDERGGKKRAFWRKPT
ncbi:MAG: diadenylate cyclase CdaA [Oscillospiraceae bacterium]|nr:diadenylate cyclase CdaA [Oscillospiraceae bacterium]